MRLPSGPQLALGGAALVALGAIAGSASSLYAIATKAQMSAPWSLPVSLDVLALVAAIAVRARRRDGLAWFALTTATALSTALQVVDAPADLLARLSHGAPPVSALVAFELALRARGEDLTETPSTPLDEAELRPAAPTLASPGLVASTGKPPRNGQRPAAVNGTPRRKSNGRSAVSSDRGSSRSVDELLPEAKLIAQRIAADDLPLTRDRLVAAFRDAGTPIGSSKATELLNRLRA